MQSVEETSKIQYVVYSYAKVFAYMSMYRERLVKGDYRDYKLKSNKPGVLQLCITDFQRQYWYIPLGRKSDKKFKIAQVPLNLMWVERHA